MDPGDLGPLQAKTGHEAFLSKGKGIDAFLERRGGEGSRHPLIDNDDAWTGPDFPAIALAQIVEVGLSHEKERVTKLLDTRLEAIRGRDSLIVAKRPAAGDQRAVAVLGPDEKACLKNARKDENRLGRVTQFPCGRSGGVELPKSGARIAADFGRGVGVEEWRRAKDGAAGQKQDRQPAPTEEVLHRLKRMLAF